MLLFAGCVSLRINKLDVPQSIAKGTPVSLHCNFDLEGDELYSVKWYKNYVEFYRYLPSDKPTSGQMFKLKGIAVDLLKSNASHVRLITTDLDSEGTYACEVSTESPSFTTLRNEKQMKVFVLPKEGPRIDGGETTYSINSLVNLTCVSGASYPAASLTWRINEQTANKELIHYATETVNSSLKIARLGLQFHASHYYFHKGVLRLQCISEIILVYQFESYRSLIGGTPKNTSNNGHYTWSKGWSSTSDEETPIILGGKEKYQVGQLMDLNCTTRFQEASLKWYIKSEEANESQLVRYSLSETVRPILGLRFRMQNRHFQMQELKLRCLAIHRRMIERKSTILGITTYENEERLQVSPNTENYANRAKQAEFGIATTNSVLFFCWITFWTHLTR